MPTPLPISGPSFWASATPGTTVYQDGDVLYVVLQDTATMSIVYRTATELFRTTVERESLNNQLDVVVNGNFYDLTSGGKFKAFVGNNPIDASATTPNGRLVKNTAIVGGRGAPDMFYISQALGPTSTYSFGSGDPPLTATQAALGGAGPLILGGLRYGKGNRYTPGTPASAPTTGPPPDQFAGNLIQRNNNTYAAAADRDPRTGKTAIGHSSTTKRLIVICQPHAAGTGITHDDLRDKLFNVGVDDAIFLDGSDSAMLYVDRVWLARQAPRKDQTNTIGVGFSI